MQGFHLIEALAGILTLVVWSYLLIGHGRFWRVEEKIIAAAPSRAQEDARVAVVIPARNEADVVGRCIASLARQTWSGPLLIVLVDDGSTDGTTQAARDAASRSGSAAQLVVLQGTTLPAGWSGKLWAMHQGIQRALEFAPDFLLLTDADIEHASGNIASLMATANRGGYDLTSLMVRLHCGSVAEKLLIPAFVFFFFKVYPPNWIADPRKRVAGAAGGCMLVRPPALAEAGGVAAISSEVIDDCSLAKAIKSSGGRVCLGLAGGTSSLRPYGSFQAIGNMIARSAFSQLKHSALLLAGCVLGMAITYLAPPVLVLLGLSTHRALPALLGAAAWLMMSGAYLPLVRFYGLNPLWAVTLPLTAIFYLGATFLSAFRYWSGRGGQWKGRAQDIARERSATPAP